MVRYVGYPLEQVRHISYQLSYAVKVCIHLINNNNIWISTYTYHHQYNWLDTQPLRVSHPKTRVHVISIHVALCCFPFKWGRSVKLSCCFAPHLVWTVDTPLTLLLTTFGSASKALLQDATKI